MAIFQRSEAIIAACLLVALIVIGLINPAFWQLDNILSLVKSNIVIGIMALGVLMIMISGGVDVSFPAFAVAAMYLTIKWMLYFNYDGVFFPFISAMTMGLLFGSFNAFFVYRFR